MPGNLLSGQRSAQSTNTPNGGSPKNMASMVKDNWRLSTPATIAVLGLLAGVFLVALNRGFRPVNVGISTPNALDFAKVAAYIIAFGIVWRTIAANLSDTAIGKAMAVIY